MTIERHRSNTRMSRVVTRVEGRLACPELAVEIQVPATRRDPQRGDSHRSSDKE